MSHRHPPVCPRPSARPDASGPCRRLPGAWAAAGALAVALALPAGTAQAIDLTGLPGVVVTSSGDYAFAGPANGPRANVLDGSLTTYWNGGGFGGWLQIDFGQSYVIDWVDVYGAANSAGAARHNSFNLSVSETGSGFSTIGSGSYGNDTGLALTPQWGDHLAFSGAAAPQGRYLRWTWTGGSDWAHIAELDVQGHLASAPVPEAGSAAMLAAGLGALALVARRRRRAG